MPVEIYYTRHAKSLAQAGEDRIDLPLCAEGVEQAKLLEGHYDYVMVSPLRRCLETLHYSKITSGERIVCNNFRERIEGIGSMFLFEDPHLETDQEFWSRVSLFEQELDRLRSRASGDSGQIKKILLVGHAYFFNAWYRKGCFPSPQNATIMRIFE